MNFGNMSLFKNTKKKIGAGVANKKAKAKAKADKNRREDNKKLGKVVWQAFEGVNGAMSSQQLALMLKHISEMLYTGSRFIGKTDYLIADFCQDVSKGYGSDWTGMFIRTVYSGLEDAIKKAKKIILNAFPPGSENPARWKASKSDYMFVWKQGETLKFRAIRTADDYEQKAHGQEIAWLAMDEITSWADDTVYTKLKSCNRAALREDGTSVPVRTRTTCNPSGSGKLWVRDYFVVPADFGTVIEQEVEDDDGNVYTKKRICIQGNWRENPYADLNYIRDNILTLKYTNKSLYYEWSEGDWFQTNGTMFSDAYDPGVHNLDNFEVPKSWKIWWSYDHGTHDPFSALFYAASDGITPVFIDGKLRTFRKNSTFVIDEIYGADPHNRKKGLNYDTEKIVLIIKNKMKELLSTICVNHEDFGEGIAEYMLWEGASRGKCEADTFKNNGLQIKKCKKKGKWSIESRCRLIIDMLSASTKETSVVNPLYFCERAKMLKINLMSLVSDETNLSRPEKGQADHDFDSFTYGMQKRLAKQIT